MIASEKLTRIAVRAYLDGADSGPGGITEREQLAAVINYIDDRGWWQIGRNAVLLAIGAAQERLGMVTCPDGRGPGGSDAAPGTY